MFAEQPPAPVAHACYGYPAKKKSAIASQGSLEIPYHDCKLADQALRNVTEGNAMRALPWAELRPRSAAEVMAFWGGAAPVMGMTLSWTLP